MVAHLPAEVFELVSGVVERLEGEHFVLFSTEPVTIAVGLVEEPEGVMAGCRLVEPSQGGSLILGEVIALQEAHSKVVSALMTS